MNQEVTGLYLICDNMKSGINIRFIALSDKYTVNLNLKEDSKDDFGESA